MCKNKASSKQLKYILQIHMNDFSDQQENDRRACHPINLQLIASLNSDKCLFYVCHISNERALFSFLNKRKVYICTYINVL